MNDSSKFANERLEAARRAKDMSKRLAWAGTIGAVGLLSLLALALVDYWIVLSVPARAGGALLLAGLIGYGLFRFITYWRQPTRLKEVALDAEAQHPDAGCVVSTAAEYLSGQRKAVHEYEPELVAALEAQAAENLRKTDLSYTKGLLGPIGIFATAVIAVLIFVLVAPVAFIALKRTAFPWMKTSYTQVEVKPGNAEIPVGHDLDVTNIFRGRLPKDPTFSWREEGRPEWQTVALTKSKNGEYVHPLKNVRASLKYRVTGSDAVSDDYEVKTYVPPEVMDFRIQMDYPDYTRLKPAVQQSPDISVLRASIATFRITSSVKLGHARLRFSSLPGVELTAGQDNLWMGSLKVDKDSDYWIELTDEKGHRGGNTMAYHIKALPDKPPKVEILEPGMDTRADATNSVPLKISAADDFGVNEVKVIYHKLGGPEQMMICKRESEKNGTVTASAELNLASLGLKEYDLVAYHAEATDNNTLDGPGVGKSPLYFIEITNEEGGSSKLKGKGQPPVNLLVIQKQIIADTTALSPNPAEEKFQELAARQKAATDFGRMYLEAMATHAAPAQAVSLMDEAIKEMERATGLLGKRQRDDALPPEEKALANFYQILKLVPELENLPTAPKLAQPQQEKKEQSEMINVVLQAIKQKKKEQPDNNEIEDALQEAKDLQRAQAGINAAAKKSGQAAGEAETRESQQAKDQEETKAQESKDGKEGQDTKEANAKGKGKGKGKGTGKGKGEGKGEGEGQAGQAAGKAQPAEGKPGDKQDEAKAEEGKDGKQDQETKEANAQGKGKGNGKGQAGLKAEGERKGEDGPKDAKDADAGKGAKGEPVDKPKDSLEDLKPGQLAEKENQLSQEAAALAEKLEALAGKDVRLGHNAGKPMSRAAAKMGAATQALKEGRFGNAGIYGYQGEIEVNKTIAELERILKDQPVLTDVASEDFPKDYEGLISEYLKKLSYAE